MFIAESVNEKKIKIGKCLAKLQARTWLARALVRLANTLLKDGKRAGNNHVLACNFAKYSLIMIIFFHAQSVNNLTFREVQGAVGFLISI